MLGFQSGMEHGIWQRSPRLVSPPSPVPVFSLHIPSASCLPSGQCCRTQGFSWVEAELAQPRRDTREAPPLLLATL